MTLVERTIGFEKASSGSFLEKIRSGQLRILHPTALGFDQSAWEELETDWSSDPDYQRVASAAIWIAGQISGLRKTLLPIYPGLSKNEALRLSISNLNYAFFKRAKEIDQFHKEKAKELGYYSPFIFGTAPKEEETGQQIDFDSFTTTIVDSLPHIIYHALRSEHDASELNTIDVEHERFRAFFFGNIESVYRYIWQQVLWEGYRIEYSHPKIAFLPPNDEYAAIWPTWDQHRQTITMGRMSALGFGMFGTKQLVSATDHCPHKQAFAANWRGKSWELRTRKSKEDKIIETRIASVIISIGLSSLSNFLDHRISDQSSATFFDLIKAWVFLDGVQKVFAQKSKRLREKDAISKNVNAIVINKTHLTDVLADSIPFDQKTARQCLSFLTANTDDVGRLFNKGVWDCPLIEVDDSHLSLAAPVLDVGNIARTFQHWVERAKGTHGGLLKGNEFERQLTERLHEDLQDTELQLDGKVLGPRLIFSGEEIDACLLLGELAVVIEAKCLLTPGDPLERYNFLTQLSEGASQAKRKALAIENGLEEFRQAFSCPRIKKVFPIVVTPDSFGAGLDFDGVPVVESHFLDIILSVNTMNVALAQKENRRITKSHRLYSSSRFNADEFIHNCRNPYLISKFRSEVEFSMQPFPSGIPGIQFEMHFPTLIQRPEIDLDLLR